MVWVAPQPWFPKT